MISDPLLKISDVTFSYPTRVIFQALNLTVAAGQIVAIMGPSGCGKTTLLRLIGGLCRTQQGKILFDNQDIPTLSRHQLYTARKKMSFLFQSGALFTDLTLFDNVAFPLRQHTKLPEKLIKTLVLMKLEAVGLRGASHLLPAQLSGGMAHRAALARAIALDPQLILFDEPFAGQDPITTGVLVKLIVELNNALGAACIIVSHEINTVLNMADHACIIAEQTIIAQGSPAALRRSSDQWVNQFLRGSADGPIAFQYPAGDYHRALFS